MLRNWKIFGVINVIEGILIVLMLSYLVLTTINDWAPFSIKDAETAGEAMGRAILFVFLIAVVFNCFNNYLMSTVALSENSKKVKKRFWSLFSAFLLFILFFISLAFRFNFLDFTYTRAILFADILLIDVFGVYILIYQVLLANLLNRAYKKNIEASAVSEIGS